MDVADRPMFPVSRAAELAGMHPQTLRQYDRLGLVVPSRTAGRGRRYSARDVERLRTVQQLSQEEGINLAGIMRILDLQDEVRALRERLRALTSATEAGHRVFAADATGDIVALPRGKRQARVRTASRTMPLPARRASGASRTSVIGARPLACTPSRVASSPNRIGIDWSPC